MYIKMPSKIKTFDRRQAEGMKKQQLGLPLLLPMSPTNAPHYYHQYFHHISV